MNRKEGVMKFTKSPAVEVTVGGRVVSFQEDNDSFHVGTSVWPCSLVLVKFADRWVSSSEINPYGEVLDFGSKRGVELGCGCGVAGMGLFLLGLTDLVLTDIAAVMPALKHNLKRNKPLLSSSAGSRRSHLKHSVLYWNNLDQIAALNPPFDVVVATDVVYIEETVGPLVRAMAALLADDGVLLLGYQLRSPEAHQVFWEMSEAVFEVQKVPHDHLHPDYAYQEADVFIFRKKNNNNNNNIAN